jgi:hypothetical protein
MDQEFYKKKNIFIPINLVKKKKKRDVAVLARFNAVHSLLFLCATILITNKLFFGSNL